MAWRTMDSNEYQGVDVRRLSGLELAKYVLLRLENNSDMS